MAYLIIAIPVVVLVVVVSIWTIYRAAYHEEEVRSVKAWFDNQRQIFPPQPLKPEHAATVKTAMENDHDLWWYLGRGCDDITDRSDYYQKVIDFGKYFRIFGPLGVCPTQYQPVLCYGVFEDNTVEPTLRVWIEFYYQGKSVWVISENRDRKPEVARLVNFRVNHPGMVHRHTVEFTYDNLDARLSHK